MENILQCNSLTKHCGSTVALNNINLEIKRGKIFGLLGPNGGGKTTLIKLAAGILVPTSGEILINGERPNEKTKSIVSYLPEKNYLDDSMKVCEALNFFEDFYADFDRKKAEEMLKSLEIDTAMKLKALSKGTKEKVQLVLTMSRNASLYLLDEPIVGVDPAARDFIMNTIISNYAEDSTVIISTHLISDVEKILDEFVFLKNGNIVMHSSVDDLREQKGLSVDEYFREVFKC